MSTLELYHRIADSESARVRRMISELGIEVNFRNVDISESAQLEMKNQTGSIRVPALRTAEGRWLFGPAEIEGHLRSLASK
jgi:glutathione S-transferase